MTWNCFDTRLMAKSWMGGRWTSMFSSSSAVLNTAPRAGVVCLVVRVLLRSATSVCRNFC